MKAFQQHLKSSLDLETTYEAIRAGFVALALEKNRRATPYVAQARALKSAAGCGNVAGLSAPDACSLFIMQNLEYPPAS